MIFQQIVNGLVAGSVYSIFSLGMAMVYGILGILHIAHAGIYALGAYFGLLCFHFIPNFWWALVMAMAVCSVTGLIVQRFLYLPLLKLPETASLLASLGLLTVFEEIFRIVGGPYVLAFPANLGFRGIQIGRIQITNTQLLVFIVTFALLGIFWFMMNRTKVGLAMKATFQDREIASVMGVNIKNTIALNFFIGSALAGAGGVLVGVHYNSVYPTMGFVPAYKSLAIIVLGGLGSIPGTVLGAFSIGLAETLLIGFLDIPFPRDGFAFIVMILVLMFRPFGILGKA